VPLFLHKRKKELMRFAIFGNPSLSKLAGNEQNLFRLLDSFNDKIYVDDSYLQFLTKNTGWALPYTDIIKDNNFSADVVISIGGDGTFLRTATRVGSKGIPMIGVNTGRLGFLADITPDRMESVVRLIHDGNYALQKKNLLEICMEGLPEGFSPYALNDISILKHDISSMISIHTTVDDIPLITYQADGLVISTPTGSTAYSLSIGGPVITPGTNVIELTPVAPHSLTMRPIVLPNDQVISLSICSRSRSFLVSIDGHSFSCPDSTKIEIRRAPFQISVMKPDGQDFFSTLREKMMWGVDNRQ
jgi:NAD+ kinase